MGTGLYSVKNETVRFVTVSELSAEMRSAVGAFFRRSGLSNGFYELIDPLTQQTKFVLAAAVTDRPWPPRGVGAIEIQALVVAVIGDGDRAFLTPVIAGPENTTNVGLSAAVMKELLRGLQELKIEKVVFLAHEGSHLVAHILKNAGFTPTQEQVITDQAHYVHYSATLDTVSQSLGLSELRTGDLLSHAIEPSRLSQLGLFHLGLSAGATNFWHERSSWVELLPGLFDWIATLPPGGIGGTPGPKIPNINDGEVIR
jgi:hypothetical protein